MKLKEIRNKIDKLDKELLDLIDERMELGLRASKYKDEITDSKREQAIIEKARARHSNLLSPEFTQDILQRLVAESKRLQAQNRKLVAFQGERGAYSDVASRAMVLEGAFISCLEFSDVFEGVADGEFDFGVVPVENSLEGAVTQVIELLAATDLKVIGEVSIPIHHCLPADEDTTLNFTRFLLLSKEEQFPHDTL